MSLMKARQRQESYAGDAPQQSMVPCRQCSTSATWQQLSDHGGLCAGCYRSYCNSPVKPAPYNQTTHGPRAWALTFKAREQRGDRLTPVQKAAWREALREHLTVAA
jgi:hypothetical protein